jgi:hypothetical protein
VDPEETAVSRQRYGKHVYLAVDTHPTIEELLEAVFYVWFMLRLYSEGHQENKPKSDIEYIRGLNLAAVKLTTVQVTKLPF